MKRVAGAAHVLAQLAGMLLGLLALFAPLTPLPALPAALPLPAGA